MIHNGYEFKVGDRVKYVGSRYTSVICLKDVGKIGIIIDMDTERVKIDLPDCHSPNGQYWRVYYESIRPVEKQLMLFEL